MFDVPELEHSFVSVSSLVDENQTMKLLLNTFFVIKDPCVVSVGQHVIRIHFANLREAGAKASATSDVRKTFHKLDVQGWGM